MWQEIELISSNQYVTNAHAENEIIGTRSLTVTWGKKRKHLGISLMTEEKDLNNEKFKPLKKDTRKWIDSPCSWIGYI